MRKRGALVLGALVLISIMLIVPIASAQDINLGILTIDDNSFAGQIINFFQNLFASGITGKVTWNPADCPSGIVSYWTFDAGDARDDYDANNGTVNGATPTTGKVGTAFSFDGVNDFVNVSDNDVWTFMNSNFAISMWVKFDVVTGRTNGLIGQRESSTKEMMLYVDSPSSNNVVFGQYETVPGWVTLYYATWTPVVGTWYHLLLQRNGSGAPGIYVNNAALSVTTSKSWGTTSNLAAPLMIGRGSGYYLDGQMDEVAIFNRALTATEIQQMYNNSLAGKGYCVAAAAICGNSIVDVGEECDDGNTASGDGCSATCTNECPSGMVGYWQGEGDATDYFGKYNGTAYGGLAYTAGKLGRAYSFDGVNDYIDMNNEEAFQCLNSLTAMFWINFKSLSKEQIIFGNRGSAGSGWSFGTGPGFGIASNQVYFTSQYQIVNTGALATNTWYFITGTVGAGGYRKLYVNGSLVDEEDLNDMTDSNHALIIGAFDGATGYWVNATIDEVAIFNRALTASEIQQIYNNSLAGKGYCVAAAAICGNSIVDVGEECDDGNTASGDGCSATCEIEITTCPGNMAYKKAITIQENSGTALSNYQVLTTINTASLISAGKMQSDCRDILFADESQNNLPYWIESGCNSASTKIWVKIPSIAAGSTKTIYIYYGNAAASSQSNGAAVFDVFDHFEGTNLSSNWDASGVAGVSVSGSVASMKSNTEAGHSLIWKPSTFNNFCIKTRAKSSGTNPDIGLVARKQSSSGNVFDNLYVAQTAWGYDYMDSYVSGSSKRLASDQGIISGYPSNNVWRIIKFCLSGTNITYSLYNDDGTHVSTISNHTNSDWSSGYVGELVWWNDKTAYFDWFLVSKYALLEPTITVGSEEICPAVCGNGILDSGEECDDGNTVGGDGCSAVCRIEICGNNILDVGEQCDDGNIISEDGCSANCKIERCGDGIVQPGEQCDDGNSNNNDACKNSCTLNVCGDGFIYAGVEECDDNNTASGDGCSATCTIELPDADADGVPDAIDNCLTIYNPNQANSDYILNTTNIALGKPVSSSGYYGGYSPSRTVDGNYLTFWEASPKWPSWISVDLGTQKSIGKVIISWLGAHVPGYNRSATEYYIEASNDNFVSDNREIAHVTNNSKIQVNHSFNPVSARYVRLRGIIGNSAWHQVEEFEIYEAQGDILGDACDNCWYVFNPNQLDSNQNCPAPPYVSDPLCGDACEPVCGNSIIETGEQCDDGNTASGDGCSAVCILEYCGDNITQRGVGEECDDNNTASGDGCASDCKIELPNCGKGYTEGMVSYWTIDNSFNPGKDDYDAHDLISYGDAAYASNGKINGAYDVSGTGYAEYAGPATTAVDNFTMMAWVNLDDVPLYEYAEIFYNGHGGNSGYGFGIGSQWHFAILYGGVTWNDCAVALNRSIWYHLAIVRDSGYAHMYVNGVDTGFNILGPETSPATPAEYTTIGWNHQHSKIKGLVDEAAIFNRALSASEIQQMYNDGLAGKGYCIICGNNITETGEQCDDGNIISEDGCSATCIVEYCGDNVTQAGLGEQCDDGNTVSGDGCSATCIAEYCGDNVVQAGLGEICDDGAQNGIPCAAGYGEVCDYCDVTCKPVTVTGIYCGDEIINGPEECDTFELAGKSCTDFGFDGGLLKCSECQFDTSSCKYTKQEICNGIDDDCDGLVDEDLTRQCGVSDVGICAFGTEYCEDGAWINCTAIFPESEVCDGYDNDCDGSVQDETLLTQQCGNDSIAGIGICTFGIERCENGGWFDCSAQFPMTEMCNGMDDDCNEITDESDNGNYVGSTCGSDVGICEFGTYVCSAGELICPEGMVGYWQAEDNANDSVDANHGTLYGDTTYVPGMIGNAFSFDGSGDYVRMPVVTTAKKDVSMSAWFKSSDHTIVTQTVIWNGDGFSGYGVMLNGDGCTANYLCVVYQYVAWIDTAAACSVTDENWHHVVFIIDASGNPMLYLDGNNCWTGTNENTPNTPTDYSYLGTDGYYHGTGRLFNGLIDEASIWDKSLSAAEIQQLYQDGLEGKEACEFSGGYNFICEGGVLPAEEICDNLDNDCDGMTDESHLGVDAGTQCGLTDVGECEYGGMQCAYSEIPVSGGYWRGEGNTQDSIDANHGTLMNGATFAAGKVGNAFSFDGIDDYVEIPDSDSLDITEQITLATWVNFDELRNCDILRKGNDLILQYGWGDELRLIIGSSGFTTPISINPGAWYHFAATSDGSNVKLYLDGVQIYSASESVSIPVTGDILQIGGFYDFVKGKLDEVAIFNSALTASEIQQMYNNGLAGEEYPEIAESQYGFTCVGAIDPVPETCPQDGKDNDCNGLIDDIMCCVDNDGDGYGVCPNCGVSSYGCMYDGDDCNDADTSIYPGAAETACNGIDNDCDSTIDEEFATPPTTMDNYVDSAWKNTAQTIALTAVKSCEYVPIKETKHCASLTPGCAPDTTGTTISITTDGSWHVSYQSTDSNNNVETAKQINVKIDRTPPSDPALNALPQWSKTGDVSLSWSASDASISGLDRYEALRASKPEGGIQSDYIKVSENLHVLSFTDTGLATDTTYTYKIAVYDNAGNSAESSTQSITVDTVNPTVQVISPANDQIFKTSTITVSANYANTYKVNCNAQLDLQPEVDMAGDNQVAGTASYAFTGIADSLHDFTVRCSDEAGNSQADYANNVRVDTINPVTTSSFVSTEWQTTKPVLIELMCSDTGSGCDKTYYCVDTINTCSPADEFVSTIIINDEGTNYIRFYSTDKAGNAETVKSQIVKIDTIAPAIADDYGYDSIWINSDQQVTLSPSDAASGIDTVRYCEGTACTPANVLAAPYQLSYTANQDTIVRYLAVDNAGLTSEIGSYNVKLDKIVPVTTDDNAFNNVWTNLNQMTVALTATDNLAGIKQTDYCINGACSVYSQPLTFNADNVYTLTYYSTDNANNQETQKSTVIKLDATPPLINITVTPKSWTECAAGGWFFWLVWFVDSGNVSEGITYPLVHGCAEINAIIDASISGLQSYNIKLYDQNDNLVMQSANSGIDFNFDTSMAYYRVVVEANDNANNYATTAMTVYEDDDEDLVPDIFDLCPTIKPAVDVNKDGCPDEPGVPSEAWDKCINIYSGAASSSIYPTSALNTFTGENIIKGDKTWYGFNSAIANIAAVSYINMKVEAEATVTNCNFDLKQLDSTTEKGKKHYLTIDKDVKVKEENKTAEGGNYNLQETWKLELDEGSKIRANSHYNMLEGKSKIHITYENKDKEKVCSDGCEANKKACLALCDKKNKVCIDSCNSNDKTCKDNCRDTYNFNIKQDYSGMKTLSLYDILKLIGYA